MWKRLLAVFRRRRLDRDFALELETHASLLEDEHRGRGLSPEEAKRAARLSLGSTAELREAHADARGLPALESVWRDITYGFRTLRRDPGFSIFALLIGALGIAASTSVFSIVSALLVRQLPVRDPATLVWVANRNVGQPGDLSNETIPVNPFVEFRQQAKSFDSMAAFFAFYSPGDQILTGVDQPERLTAVPISNNFFDVLGVAPKLGRYFTEQEARTNAPVVLLSEGFWHRRFASDPAILGKSLTINNRPSTVIGIVPFDFGSLLTPGTPVDFFRPLPLTPEVSRMGNTLSMIGRLRSGTTIEQARAEADVISGPIGARHNRTGLRLDMMPFEQRIRGAIRPALFLLAGAVAVVMLILCSNLSLLQLARASARGKEVSVRLAMGASRARLLQQMLLENLVLFAAAGALGFALAAAATRMLSSLDSLLIPLREAVHVDFTAFLFSLLIAVAVSLISALAPAMQLPFRSVHDGLKETTKGASAGRHQNWLRSTLVVAEIAFACVLLTGAGLLIRSFVQLLDVELGFQPQHAAALRLAPFVPKGEKRNAYFDDLLSRVRALPGMHSAGITDVLPLGGNRSWGVGVNGQTYSESSPPPDAFVRIVSDGYFAGMGIPLKSGRDFDLRDRQGAKPVIIVNESLARTLWPGQNPIGQFLRFVDREVVGVVADVRHIRLEQPSGFEIYLPIRQTNDYGQIDLVFRSTVAPTAMLPSIREALLPIEPLIAANKLQTLETLIDRATSSRRFVTLLLLGFSAFALTLASLGLYGLISYSVSQRKQEIGIRLALGAKPSDIQRRVLGGTLSLAATGLMIGIAASWLLAGAVSGMLFGVTASDPVTLATVAGTLGTVAALAGYLPSLRASRTDPVLALRAS